MVIKEQGCVERGCELCGKSRAFGLISSVDARVLVEGTVVVEEIEAVLPTTQIVVYPIDGPAPLLPPSAPLVLVPWADKRAMQDREEKAMERDRNER